jgi:GMC oxidoreductase
MTHDAEPPSGRRFFDAHQRAMIEAAMARIIPTDNEPGAREAGTVDNLFAVDGSPFPTATGANPTLTIMAMPGERRTTSSPNGDDQKLEVESLRGRQ